MQDPLGVHVPNGIGNLREVSPDHTLCERCSSFLRLADAPLKVASRGPLEHDDEFIAVDEGVQVFDDVGVVHALNQAHLLQTLLT